MAPEDIKHRAAAAVSKYETMAARIEKERGEMGQFFGAQIITIIAVLYVLLW